MNRDELHDLATTARAIAHEAGEIHLRYYERLQPEEVAHKGPIDLVTVADPPFET